ncbi:transcriptional coactivator p15, PC4 protein [Medicago truncatula]|uniref:Transcriptional coactivator p15, PC4 protein n=1 Tax=Medicago truncatula TaxID=3880 RepID=A0A072TPA4_MEDTR|nr:transcriptional coactivator p15, PC4 protein [Medicago truncatula]KEH19243.1 transcriptional coactivator p15, PC4 protein [Medicago truncatula]
MSIRICFFQDFTQTILCPSFEEPRSKTTISSSGSDSEYALKRWTKSDPDDEIVVCDLGSSKDGHKMVCVKSWKKQIWIDIRECYFEEGIRKNDRKGISLPMMRWIKLRSCIREIDNAVD